MTGRSQLRLGHELGAIPSDDRTQSGCPRPPKGTGKVPVWDPFVRFFHWSLVGAFAVTYFTQEQDYGTHLNAGYAVLALLAFRIVWGVVGPRHARFSDFVRGPGLVVNYLRSLAARRPVRYLGHNPAGGAMIVALLITLLVVCLSGIALDAAENRSGPLADTNLFQHLRLIETTHELATDIALVLVGLHVLGVLLSSLLHRENLVLAMITGRKTAE